MSIYDDVTEKKQAEAELCELNQSLEVKVADETNKRLEQESILIHQSKMATMGEMITMIAHQWRQPLNALAINVQTTEVVHKMGELDDEYITEFKESSMSIINRMSKTIEDFRGFFKQNKQKERLSVEDAVKQMLRIMEPLLSTENIKLNFNPDSEHFVYGYKNELEQALLILISNAKDAIKSYNTKEPYITIKVSESALNKIVITIEDNGGGIPKDILSKIFEPYFTTKGDEHGTGIGLYMAKEIVERHMNGKIDAQNITDGVAFRIELNKNGEAADTHP